uniref:Uncharacterized protein n=1 Tax=Ditylenchus dipsaci TaxID=166011 RepID=A0A915DY50_9BILA
MNDALLKFIITSGQWVNLMGDKSFIEFLDSFPKPSIDAEKAGPKRLQKNLGSVKPSGRNLCRSGSQP